MRAIKRACVKRGAVCATAVAIACALIAVVAQAATVRPRLVQTTATQIATDHSMQITEYFKVSKADSILAAKAIICVKSLCKTDVISKTSRPTAGAVATEYTPNALFKVDDAKLEVTVKTTLVVGSDRYTYVSKAKDVLSPCVVGRGTGSGLLPDC